MVRLEMVHYKLHVELAFRKTAKGTYYLGKWTFSVFRFVALRVVELVTRRG